ncbi:tol-pal system protein YbgF [Ensifer soli]|uniref:tol-pal system protein YbgF n=1 Tax=Ciceribacter sp. sgz301302 TaxID=3342379 RepID=UPI0035B7D003
MKQFAVAGMIGLFALAAIGQPVSAMPLSGLAEAGAAPLPVVRVQGSEAARVMQLEEQIRSLNGRIEEMSFQLLQMQEQIRKFQEDNEFRFQDLENGQSGQTKKSGAVTTAPATGDTASAAPEIAGDDMAATAETAPLSGPPGSGEATLGSIIFDNNGNPVDATETPPERQASLGNTLPGVDTGASPTPRNDRQTASLDNPEDLYQVGYAHVLAGDYSQAEQEFRDYLDVYPNGPKAADASFWMGEAQFSQGKFNDAAKTFLNAHQAHASSPKAPEMLLKLGMSLAALDNRETACATLREVSKRYPQASSAVRAKATSEQKRLSC